MKIKITLFCSACLLLFACNLTPPNAESLLVAALQNGNWNEVYNECVKDSTFKNPETLGLRGHACIILNKNNESYHCLNSMDSVQRKNWFNWTREFAKKHPKLPVSQYLFGDAHMRTGNKTEALQCFNRAVELDPAFALALNARATALALDSKFGEALKDASAACKYTEGVAEFLATLATINYKHMGAEGASSDFTKSLKISPDFSLALNGKACASLFNYHVSPEEFGKIFTDLQNKAARGLPIPLFRENGRLLMRELEKIKMPELHNTPFLAVSDFLDWYTLQQRTLQDEHDFIRYAIKKPLPESIDADVLLMLNMLLSRQDLLADYMKSAAPDSLKRIIALAGNDHPQGRESKITNYKIEYKNRIVLERLYEGLIMPCALRDAGNTISTSKLDLPKALRQGLDNFPDMGITFKLGPVSVNPVKLTQASLKIYDGFKNLTDYGNPSSNFKLDLQNEQRMKNANPAKFAEFARNQAANPGGAIAEVRKKYVDDISKPYFLVLNYGLGYDYFQ